MVRSQRSRWCGPIAVVVTAMAIGAFGGVATAGTSKPKYDPKIRPEDFGGPIDNPYFPVVPGTRWVYDAKAPEGLERIVVEVTSGTKEILGVTTAVVRDTVSVDGSVVEDTFDWYAQDHDGNVWYFGEDTKEYENGVVKSTEGSFVAGVDGAKPGIVMVAHPRVGKAYRQEYYAGHAEDRAEVLKIHASTTVPVGAFDDVVVTKEINPLDRGVVEHKHYAKGIGVILEEHVKGPSERVELVEHTES